MDEISYNISLLQDTNQMFTIQKDYLSPGVYTFSLEIKNWMDQLAENARLLTVFHFFNVLQIFCVL
jgi:hypothetical protein